MDETDPNPDEETLQRIAVNGIQIATSTEFLPCELTPAEWEAYAEEAAAKFSELTTLKAEEDARRKDWNEGHKDRQAEHRRLNKLVETRKEQRDVETRSYALLDSNELVVTRPDTGAVVRTRALTVRDREKAEQGHLFAANPADATNRHPIDDDDLPPEA